MRYRYSELTEKEQRKFAYYLDEAKANYQPTDFCFISNVAPTEKKQRNILAESEKDNIFLYFRTSMSAPMKGWKSVLQHVEEHKGIAFEYLLRNQIPSNKAILNEARDFIDASLSHWHNICDSGTAMSQDAAAVSYRQIREPRHRCRNRNRRLERRKP